MAEQELLRAAKEILAEATPEQVRWEIVAERVESMRCERCGRIWQPEPPEDQRELLGEGRSEG